MVRIWWGSLSGCKSLKNWKLALACMAAVCLPAGATEVRLERPVAEIARGLEAIGPQVRPPARFRVDEGRREEEAERARDNAKQAAEQVRKIKEKYDVGKIGDRRIGKGLNWYSVEKEIALGRQLAHEIESGVKLLSDPAVNEYVNRLGQNLVRNSDAQVPFTIKVIDDDEINAFALPGGFFYVNSGLILAAESEAELAGVMAHEIAHVAARHATKNATKSEIWNLASIPLVFLGGPVGYAVRQAAGLAVPLTMLKFSRGAEKEADLLGLEYMFATGYDPGAFITFFEKLQTKDEKRPNFVVRAFASHPPTGDRVRKTQLVIEHYLPDRDQYVVTTSEFDEVKARLARLSEMRQIDGGRGLRPVLRRRTEKKDEPPVLKRRDN